jgi:hypothetical protein
VEQARFLVCSAENQPLARQSIVEIQNEGLLCHPMPKYEELVTAGHDELFRNMVIVAGETYREARAEAGVSDACDRVLSRVHSELRDLLDASARHMHINIVRPSNEGFALRATLDGNVLDRKDGYRRELHTLLSFESDHLVQILYTLEPGQRKALLARAYKERANILASRKQEVERSQQGADLLDDYEIRAIEDQLQALKEFIDDINAQAPEKSR